MFLQASVSHSLFSSYWNAFFLKYENAHEEQRTTHSNGEFRLLFE